MKKVHSLKSLFFGLIISMIMCIPAVINAQSVMDINQTISDGAQKNTIAFDGLAFMTGGFCDCTFLPPGKVADYCGFQYYRDNDVTGMGHNTDFLTIIAYNVLHLLDTTQIHVLYNLANNQVGDIDNYAAGRFPLIKAFRRLYENDMPVGAIGLNKDTVMNYSGRLFLLDGKIAFDRARVYGQVIRSFSAQQVTDFNNLVAIPGVANWNDSLPDPLNYLHPPQEQKVALMTYASELFTWYAGSVTSDTYFCPERQCTYFGSFYMKDIPAVGNPGYSIDTNLTQHGGDLFLNTLTLSQKDKITSLVDTNRSDLYDVVSIRTQISTLLRDFMTSNTGDSTSIMNLSLEYGHLDGEMSYNLAKAFAEVGQGLTQAQIDTLYHIRNLDTFPCNGAYLYSQNIAMPAIPNTDFFFTIPNAINENPELVNVCTIFPNPFTNQTFIQLNSSVIGDIEINIMDNLGRVVRNLSKEKVTHSAHTIIWNGASDAGNEVSKGMYFCRIVYQGKTQVYPIIKQ